MVAGPEAGRKLWDRLTEEQRQTLGGSFDACLEKYRDTVELWAGLQGCSRDRALLDVCYQLDQIPSSQYQRLLGDIGEADHTDAAGMAAGVAGAAPGAAQQDASGRQASPAVLSPTWNADRGELSYRGQIVRQIRSRTVAKNITTILDVFEEEGWPPRIDDPLSGGGGPQRLREAVRSLNTNLETLVFRTDGTGEGILWEQRAAARHRSGGASPRR